MSSTQQLLLGEGAGGAAPVYIEDVFSTYLWTGNGTSQTITNNIDLSTKGGLVWIKRRDGVVNHYLATTNDGTSNYLNSNTTSGYETSVTTRITSFNTDGFSLGSAGSVNNSGSTFVGWTLREQPKFFDVVTYTGNGTSGRTVAHNLGSVPGCIIVKRTSGDPIDWLVYHRGTDTTSPQNYDLKLNTTAARVLQSGSWNDTAPTSTVFTLGDSGTGNTNGETYVAYLFAHNAGGFGLTGTDNVISCGSFTPDVYGNVTVNLGYEAQWILYKGISGAGGTDSWVILDTMRGWDMTTSDKRLFPNSSGAENTSSAGYPTATGFQVENLSASPYIYIAIRRGPMKVPTSGTSVFAPVAYAGDNLDNRLVNTGILTDMTMARARSRTSIGGFYTADRLRGDSFLRTSGSDIETTDSDTFMTPTSGVGNSFSAMNGFGVGNDVTYRVNTESDQFAYAFKRAPSFFDEVCYTGVNAGGQTLTVSHNLGVTPELVIIKTRSSVYDWLVYSATTGTSNTLFLNLSNAVTAYTFLSSPTSSTFTANGVANSDTNTYVAYLFATCPGVSKVGSYTGTGALQTVNCGFTTGARFVLIKRTDSTGDWYVWDSARGISSSTDPYLLLNSTAAEVTGTNYVDTTSVGFQVTAAASTTVNISAATYIFLAIA